MVALWDFAYGLKGLSIVLAWSFPYAEQKRNETVTLRSTERPSLNNITEFPVFPELENFPRQV